MDIIAKSCNSFANWSSEIRLCNYIIRKMHYTDHGKAYLSINCYTNSLWPESFRAKSSIKYISTMS